MSSPGSPAETRSLIIERLVGDSGDAANVIAAGRALAERALPILQHRLVTEIGAAVTIDLQAVEVSRTADARSRAGEIIAMTVVPSPASSDAVTMVMDAPAIAVMVCALFGGDPDLAAAPIERELSPVETDVATLVFEEIAQALNGSGKRSMELRLPVPMALSGADAKRRVLRDGAAVRIVFGVATAVDRGSVSIVIPQRVLLTLRGGDEQPAANAATNTDWRARFSEEVMRSAVTLEAMMPLTRLTLGEIAGLRVGQTIGLDELAQSHVRLSARNKTLFVCEFGKLGQNYTVRNQAPV